MNNFKTFFVENDSYAKESLVRFKQIITAPPYNFTLVNEDEDISKGKGLLVAKRWVGDADSIQNPFRMTHFCAYFEMGYNYAVDVCIDTPEVRWHEWPRLIGTDHNAIFAMNRGKYYILRDVDPQWWDDPQFSDWECYNLYSSWKGWRDEKITRLVNYLKPYHEKKKEWTPEMSELLPKYKLKYLGSDQITPQDWGNLI